MDILENERNLKYLRKCPPQLFAPLIKIVIEEMRKACKKDPPICGFNAEDNAYEPLKLMQTVMAKTNEVCLRYLDNSMLCSLPSPNDTPVFYPTSACAVKNSRRKMEDRHVVIHDLNTMFNIQEASPSSYFAVFDGHAGVDAAAYSAAHLHQFLAESDHYANNPKQALYEAFCKTDKHFADKCKVEHLSSGTTAVVALLRPKENTLYVAWAGDSQALLVKQGKLMQLVDPHKPSRSDEKNRIERNGGCVLYFGTWRVNGQLAVSRAIGDVDYKPHVIAVPDIIEVPLDGNEDFLVLACDGLWDFVSEEVAARTIYRLIRENTEDTERISQHLVQAAREKGSTDNISVIVVLLREASRVVATAVNNNAAVSSGAAMETALVDQGLVDNQANQTEVLFNGSNGDSHASGKQKDEVMFNFSDNYTQNGADISPTKDMDFYETEKSNGKRLFDECDDDDFGPETDVDVVDDSHGSPFASDLAGKGRDSKMYDEEYQHGNRIFDSETHDNRMFGGGDALGEYNKMFAEGHPQMFGGGDRMLEEEDEQEMFKGDEGVCNPFMEHMEKAEKEDGGMKENSKNQDEDHQRAAREETPTPPVDAVHDVSGLVDNAADSDSEDEWDYIKGEEADKENTPPRAHKGVADIPEGGEEEVGPALDDAPLVAAAAEAEADAMSQLNPNAAEFVPVSPATSPISGTPRLLDDEIIAQSPKRPMNMELNIDAKQFEKEVRSRPSELDDSFCSNGHSDNEHNLSSDMMENLLNGKNIDEIPEFQPGSTPTKSRPDEFHFGPNAAPFTPKNLDQSEALSTKALFGDDTAQNLDSPLNISADATSPVTSPIKKESDDPMSMSFYENRDDANPFDLNKVQMLPENLDEFLQQPENNTTPIVSAEQKSDDLIMNNDDVLQTTDLDKHSYDDEKELASPLEPEKELSCPDFREDGTTPEPTNENLLGGDFCQLSQKLKTPEPLPRDVELISPDSAHESKSPTEQSQPDSIPPDVELLSPELKHEEELQRTATEVDDLLGGFDSHHHQQQQDMLCERPMSDSPICERPASESPACERPESKSSACEQIASEQHVFNDNPFVAQSKEEEVNMFAVEPEEPVQKEKEPEPVDDDDVQATIVVGPQGVIEIEEEPSEYIPSPAAEPIDLEPQVIEPVQDLCLIEKPSENKEMFECTEIEVNKETNLEKPVGNVEVRMENISPQFAEQAFVMTPSEESRQEEVPTAPLLEEAVQEPVTAATPLVVETPAADHTAETAAVAAGVAAAAVASAIAAKPAEEKKKTALTAKKSPAVSSTKTASPSSRTGAKPASTASPTAKARPIPGSKASPTKTSAPKPSASTTAQKPAATKMVAPKPRTNIPPKLAEKKPLANGDVKQPPIRSSLTARKPATETAATKTAARPTTTAARPASAAPRTMISAPKPAPRPATAPKAAAPRTNGTTTTSAARMKPTTNTSKSVPSKTASTTTKTATSLTSKTSPVGKPAFTTSMKPKPAATALAPPKTRAPISRRPAAETDKQSKEAVNKATASKTTATTATRTGVTALRKVESKTASTTRTTVMKSTTTTMKSNTAATKKPAEIVRNKSAKTPTKVDKPELNGVATEVPDAVKVPVNDVLVTDSEPQLVKDNSPAIDNKTIENTLIQTNVAD